MAEAQILVVEDEPDLSAALTVLFERAGYATVAGRTGREGLRLLHEHRPDLVVLDVGLPDMEGWDVLERIRDLSDVPVLMLTARGLEHEKVKGLESGADDYVTKPFSNKELVARVQALLRRGGRAGTGDEVLVADDLHIDLGARATTVDDSPVQLTPLEFRLLVALVKHRRQVLSADQLLDLAWNDPFGIAPDRVKFTVSRLRRKLADVGIDPIETVRGFGYRYT